MKRQPNAIAAESKKAACLAVMRLNTPEDIRRINGIGLNSFNGQSLQSTLLVDWLYNGRILYYLIHLF